MDTAQYLLSNSSGHSAIRFLNLAKYCGRELLSKHDIHLSWSKDILWDDLKDTYIFSGIITPEAWDIVCEIKERGCKIIWQVDDDLFSMPESNPNKMDYTNTVVMQQCYSLVDAFYCSTNYIKDHLLSKYNKPTWVCKNLVEESPYNDVRDPNKHLYTGGSSHNDDFGDFLKYYNDHKNTDYYFLGMMPYELCSYERKGHSIVELPKYENTHRISSLLGRHYFEYNDYNNVFDQLDCAVGHVSIEDNEFNKAKSNLKVLECGIRGMDCIVSKTPCYLDDNNLSELITYYGDAYVNRSTELRKYILQNYCWSSKECRQVWLNNFKEMLK